MIEINKLIFRINITNFVIIGGNISEINVGAGSIPRMARWLVYDRNYIICGTQNRTKQQNYCDRS